MKTLFFLYCCIIISICKEKAFGKFKPDWDSLDRRPLPPWYDDAKIGIFLHWGVFSVPSYSSAWFWKYLHDGKPDIVNFMQKNYRPGFTYQDFASMFTAEFYDPKEWADIFNASGARYIVLTSKHHEGFTLWPSKYSWNWNAKDVGPKRDLLGDLARAIREFHPHIHFGLYHSLFEFLNPLYLRDKESNFTTTDFVTMKTMPELYELVNNYKPDVIWSDGDWEAKDTYWNSTNFLAWLFNESPVKETVVVNDRWGSGTACKHGSFYNCHDKYNPKTVQAHKWENCMTLDKQAWTFRRNAKAQDFLTIEELLQTLVETISCGGNLLVNTGPTHEGKIAPIMEEKLRQMGEWLSINGEAVYGSRPWIHQNDSYTQTVWYTQSKAKLSVVYAFVLKWPDQNSLILGSVKSTWLTRIYMMGNDKTLPIKERSKGLEISLPSKSSCNNKWVWVLKLQRIKSRNET